MARYIESGALLEAVKNKRLLFEEGTPIEEAIAEQVSAFEEAIEEVPTTDVVPQSECDLYRKQVDELEDELASTYDKLETAKTEAERVYYTLLSVLEKSAETKQEFAREIFEEIEKILSKSRKKYSVGGYHYDYYQRDNVFVEAFVELKKKYVEIDKGDAK